MYHCFWNSPVGILTIVSNGGALTDILFSPVPPNDSILIEDSLPSYLNNAVAWLEAYFSGRQLPPPPPIHLRGTPFRIAVWERLLEIPWGQWVTYGQLAVELGSSPRAVGQAIGANPLPILIPCHRVLGAGCRITGYSGGIWRKENLLLLEEIPYKKEL